MSGTGATLPVPLQHPTGESIRELERDSIRAFLADNQDLLAGRVLDYGCGLQPYRQFVEDIGGHYEAYDRAMLPGNVSGQDIGPDTPLNLDWDAIVSTQTIQYVKPWFLADWLASFRAALEVRHGVLLLTGPGCWPEVETADICRYTAAGIAGLLSDVGFDPVQVAERAPFLAGTVQLCTGWQAVART